MTETTTAPAPAPAPVSAGPAAAGRWPLTAAFAAAFRRLARDGYALARQPLWTLLRGRPGRAGCALLLLAGGATDTASTDYAVGLARGYREANPLAHAGMGALGGTTAFMALTLLPVVGFALLLLPTPRRRLEHVVQALGYLLLAAKLAVSISNLTQL